MLIIPELKKVVITPPRSGSTALRAMVMAQYEQASNPYRHGEVQMLRYTSVHNLVLAGEYKIVYILRNPQDRMISLWRYMHDVSYTRNARAPKEWVDRVHADANRPYNEWLVGSKELFNKSTAHPLDDVPESKYCTWYQIPAARKSAKQFLHSAPPRSVELVRFMDSADYMRVLGINIDEYELGDARNESTKRYADQSCTAAHIACHHSHDINLMGIA